MAEGFSGLLSALQERDKLLAFASRLDSLKEEGTLSDDEYATGRADYDDRIEASTKRVDALKAALGKELEASEREAEMCRLKLESAEAQHEAGDLSAAAFTAEKAHWDAQLRRIGERGEALEAALAAEVATDLAGLAPPVEPKQQKTGARIPARSKTRVPAPRIDEARPSTPSRKWPPLRIAALVVAALLFISVRLAWVAAAPTLNASSAADPGVYVSFLAGLAGFLGGLASIGFTFIPRLRVRGALLLATGAICLGALVAAVVLEELPLLNSYFRDLVVLREGFYLYIVAAAALVVLGILQARRYA